VAEAAFYRPLWSERILPEVEAAILGFRPDLDPVRVRRRLLLMSATFEDAYVGGWERCRQDWTFLILTTGTFSRPQSPAARKPS
jgi:hypothetical protein